MSKILNLSIVFVFFIQLHAKSQTAITKWKDDKKGAVSITYDDGNLNQFKYALPIMERLHLNDIASLTLYAVRKGLVKP